jgi:hypothetical protein
MPIDYEINSQLQLVIAKARGTLGVDTLIDYQKEVWASPEVKGFDELVDVTEVDAFEYHSVEKIRELASLAAKMDWINHSKKFAIVAKDDAAFGLGRMYQAYRETEPLTKKEVQIFRSMEQARQWLGR